MKFRCPNCDHAIQIVPSRELGTTVFEELSCPSCNSCISLPSPEETKSFPGFAPKRIGKFEIRELVGEGSFGQVFKGWDFELKRLVAIKIPRFEKSNSPDVMRQLREAQAAAQIRHPNVISVHEVGTHEGKFYIASDFVDGINLKQWIKAHEISVRESAQLIQKIAMAIQAAHDNRVIHRDLKPSNILMDKNGIPFVTDFGLAKWSSSPEATLTQDGQILGTLAYMSPEQAAGHVKQISNRSDIYALGVMLYELITHKKPFSATDSRTYLYMVQTSEPTSPRKVSNAIPNDLETICLKAMRKEALKRYGSAREMADDLERFLCGKPITARPVTGIERTALWVKRNPVVSALAGIAFTFAVIAAASFLRPPVIGPVVPEKTHVAIEVSSGIPVSAVMTGARWAIVPVDEDRKLESEKITREYGKKVELDLEPGDYLVVVDVPGVGFHEVYRTVPVDMNSRPGNFAHNSWKILGNDTIEWPRITLDVDSQVEQNLIEIPGGTFEMGIVGNSVSPVHSRHVNSFLIGRTETTFAQYTEHLPIPGIYEIVDSAWPRGEFPIIGINWNCVAAYAELVGCRTITEAEYEFVATNGGTTLYPWGNDKSLIKPWKLQSVGEKSADKSNFGVLGLFSNSAELCDSILSPYPGATKTLAELIQRQTRQGRVFRGGPREIDENSTNADWTDGVRRRASLDVLETAGNVSFRVGRSLSPRFIEP